MDSSKKIRVNVFLLTAALGMLTLGVLVYLLDRQPETIYFMPEWLLLTDSFSPVFGILGDQLPTFIHVYAFILLTFVVLSPSLRMLVPICMGWFVLDCILELAQISIFAQLIANHIPSWFAGIPFLENTAGYFLSGTYDLMDIVSIAMGTVVAYLTIRFSIGGDKDHETTIQTA